MKFFFTKVFFFYIIKYVFREINIRICAIDEFEENRGVRI